MCNGIGTPDAFERSVLGALLVDSTIWPLVAQLNEDDFFLDSHRRIFSRMRELHDLGNPIDVLALAAALEQHNELEVIGGMPYLGTLLDGAVPESIAHYVAAIRENAQRRKFRKNAEHAQRIASDPTVNPSALAEAAHAMYQVASYREPLPPRFSEEALALRFSRQYANDLRYVSRWGQWMSWDGMRWIDDDTLHVFDLARGVCRAASAECNDTERATAVKVASKATSAAVERLAAADRKHAAKVEQWDADAWLLNTPRGTVDLRTGDIRQHRRDDYITKITSAGLAEIALCGCGSSTALPAATRT